MNDEEKLYTLMAQAEDLQTHAAKLQNKAEETFSAFPLAVEQAGQKIRSMGLQMALILLAFGCIIGGAVFAALLWFTNSLREERDTLQNDLADLKDTIQVEEATLAEMKSKTWGLRLLENQDGRFIILPKGTQIEQGLWNKEPAIRLVK